MKRLFVICLSVVAIMIIVTVAAFTYKAKYCKTGDKAISFFFDGRKPEVKNDPYEIQKLTDGMNNLCGFDDEKRIIEIYQSYANVHDVTNTEKRDEIINELVMLYGSNHFPSVDSKNKVDMVSREYLTEFCRKVSNDEAGKCTLIAVDSPTRLIRYGFDTQNGKVTVYKTWYKFDAENIEVIDNIVFEADEWKVDDEYIMFSGGYYSDMMYALTMSDGLEYDAIRIAPLDSKCRELAKTDPLKIGYKANNVFLVNWDRNDYSELDADDIIGYLCEQSVINLDKYVCEEDEFGNRIYYIPEKEYEEGVQSIIEIDGDELKKKSTYNPALKTYAFRHRGVAEAEVPDYPYIEVIEYELMGDTKTRLTVNAVYPQMLTHNVLTSEVVIKKSQDGINRICSNKVISKDENNLNWHTDRLPTRTAFLEDFIISQNDIRRLNEKALSFKKSDNTDECIFENGKMRNGKVLEDFYHEYEDGEKAEAEVFTLKEDGTYTMTEFVCDGRKVNTYFANVERNNADQKGITVSSVNIVDSLKLTEKGYFIYGLRYLIEHASIRNYWRIYPLSEDCQKLTDKYIKGMDFTIYNLFISNWLEETAESVLMDGVFDDLYRIDTGEVFKPENGCISARLFEDIMTRYLPVSVNELREAFSYDSEKDVYEYNPVYPGTPYIPFGEVIDYQKNPDGSIDLTVDGVWPDYDSDCGFRCYVKVMPCSDGSFMYLSNQVEAVELRIPKVNRY